MFRSSALNAFKCLIMGPPGSGKGTISSRIIKDFPLKYLSSGDLLRLNLTNKTEIGLLANTYMTDGKLVPDTVITDLILSEVKKIKNNDYLLDGYPRTVEQAKTLDSIEKIDCVVNLDIPFQIIINRLKQRWTHLPSGRIYHLEFNPPRIFGLDDITGEPLEQRDDDKPETVALRLENYRSLADPVLYHYRLQGIVTDFAGKYSNEIWPKVHEFLSTQIKPLQFTKYK